MQGSPGATEPRQKRVRHVFTFEQVQQALDTGYLEVGQGMRLKPAISQANLEHRRSESPKGPKTLRSLPIDTDLPAAHAGQLAVYDAILVVDTNTDDVGDARVSVTASLLCKVVARERHAYTASVGGAAATEFRNLQAPQEVHGWRHAIAQLQASPDRYRAGQRVLVVVDAHLGELPVWNARNAEMLPGYSLPDGFTLMYASDRGAHELPNKLIKAAHNTAKEIMNKIARGERGETGLVPVMGGGMPYTHRRSWELDSFSMGAGWRHTKKTK